MSGGSFDYIESQEPTPLLDAYRRMQEQLRTYGEAGALAQADFGLLVAASEMVAYLHQRLRPVMHAVEWHVSCDYLEEQVRDCLKAYGEAHKVKGW